LGVTGLEPDHAKSRDNKDLQDSKESSAALCAAVDGDSANLPPELTLIFNAWPDLPESVKAEILATVRAQIPEAKQ
jgi:hypothetical protein